MHASSRLSSDLGRNLLQLLRSPVTWSLVAALCLIRGVMTFALQAGEVDWMYLHLGLSRQGIGGGEVWQLLSSSLLHSGFQHAAMNGVLLLLAGSKVEHIAGWSGILKVFLAGVLGGAVLHLLLSDHILVGASAGALALLLYLTTLSPDSRILMPFKVSGKNLGRGLILGSLVLLLIDPGHAIPYLSRCGEWLSAHKLGSLFRVSHAGHLGGALAGCIMARWALRPRVSLESLKRDRAKRERAGS